jgi:hypothetical protein
MKAASVVFVSALLAGVATSQRVNNTCINSKLDGLHSAVFDHFEKVAALTTFGDARILSYTNESAEILTLYSK